MSAVSLPPHKFAYPPLFVTDCMKLKGIRGGLKWHKISTMLRETQTDMHIDRHRDSMLTS
jgi:hypothetical protein